MEHRRYLPVARNWIDLFTHDAMKKVDLSLSPKASDNVRQMLWRRIWVVSVQILEKYTDNFIEEQNPFFTVDPDLIPEDEIKKNISEVAQKIGNEGSDCFVKDYPLLKEKVQTICCLFVIFFNEMIDRIKKYKTDISEKLLNGVPFNEILSFSGDGADVHNDGKTSIIVSTDVGKFLYKPHDCKTDVLFKKIVDKYFSTIVDVPDILYVNEDYSFIEYVTNKVADTEKDAALYYENLGGFCAVETFLNGSDFHEENILAHGSIPVPVDFETVLMAITPSVYKPSAEEDINRSVFRTSMFSVASANLKIRESSPLFDLSDNNIAAPVVHGNRVSAINYKEDFKRGFEKGYRCCLEVKDGIIGLIECEADLKIRILLRNTNYYSLFTDEMNGHRGMKDHENDKLFIERLERDYPIEIAFEECNSMQKGDIPYFYYRMREKNLYARGKVVKENFIVLTPFEYLKECIALRCEDELEFELNVIDRLFANTITTENCPEICTYKASQPLKRAEEIFYSIKNSSFLSPSGNICFIETRNEGYPGLLGIDLNMGKCGIALFCAALSLITDDDQIKTESLDLCNTLVSEVINQTNIVFANEQYKRSIHDDYGVRKAMRLISKYTNKPFDRDSMLDSFYGLKAKTVKNKKRFDCPTVYKDTLYNGNAAIADCLIEKYLDTSDRQYLKKAEGILMSKNSYNYTSEGVPSFFCSALMYGASGVGYELLRLAAPNAIDSVFDKE